MDVDPVPQCDFRAQNPFYAGAYMYGKSGKLIEIVDGRARKTYGHPDDWEVVIKYHHEGYVPRAEYERNVALLAANAYGRKGDQSPAVAAGRYWPPHLRALRTASGGRLCRRRTGKPIYRCNRPNLMLGLPQFVGESAGRIVPVVWQPGELCARETMR